MVRFHALVLRSFFSRLFFTLTHLHKNTIDRQYLSWYTMKEREKRMNSEEKYCRPGLDYCVRQLDRSPQTEKKLKPVNRTHLKNDVQFPDAAGSPVGNRCANIHYTSTPPPRRCHTTSTLLTSRNLFPFFTLVKLNATRNN